MPSNPNHTPNTLLEFNPEEQGVFSIAKINEWRTREHGVLAGLRESAYNTASFGNINITPDYMHQFNNSVDDLLDVFLEENSIEVDSPNYAEIRQLFYDARIGVGNGDGISEDEWNKSPADRGGDPDETKSQSDIFKERIEQRLGIGTGEVADPDQAIDPRGELSDVTLDEAYLENARFDVGTSREAWATASAKRQGRAFSMKDKNHETVKDRYHESVQKLGIMELESQIADSDTDTEKNAKVIAWLFDEQAKLRDLTTEKLQGTKVGRFVNFMNKGSRKARFAKALGLGVVAGVGGTLIAGAAGAAVVAAGAAGASRFVRGYVRGDKHRGMATAQEEFIDSGREVDPDEVEGDSIEDRFKDVANTYNVAFKEDTDKEQKKRRKALAAGVGAVALGAGIGYAVTNASEIKDTIQGGWNNFWDINTDTGTTPDSPAVVEKPEVGAWGPDNDFDGDGQLNHDDIDKDGDGVDNDTDVAPKDPDVFATLSEEARIVDPGEGWYQTFEELGIPEDHWQDVLQEAGPELQEQGWAYRMPDGQWGISQPGRLSDESIRTIVSAAERDGFTLAP